ncbi:YtpI family protein [Salinicoccus kekensis]|uniref:Bax inhibitor 1 like protein n=1 Tax=Salinicoccus kekensis TaxID=714307 RepID=A0A285UBL2_9STAP|nr:YtpI family protein [Salinicoccus kekensis]SOC39199.1 Bax inhibitor 1 like protein [Salinicoccus kekensis]
MELMYQIIVSLLVTILLVSFFMFLVYKIRQIRTNREVRTVYYNSISRIWLGILMVSFGLNSIVQFGTAVSYIVGLLFIAVGAYNIWYFNKARRKFKANLPIEEKAWEEFEKKKKTSTK